MSLYNLLLAFDVSYFPKIANLAKKIVFLIIEIEKQLNIYK